MSAIRTERLLNLLTLLLNARRPMSLRELRELEEFDAYRTDDPKSGERAFERDKAALVEMGIPLRYVPPESDEDEEGGGGYVIDRERYYLPPLELEPSELALLSIAGAAAAAIDGFPGRAAVLRALAKIGFDVDEAARPAASLAHAPFAPGVDAARSGEYLEQLHDAVARRVRVKLVYRSAAGQKSAREVDPWGLYYRQGVWYLVGFCHLRKAERTFHLARIDGVTVTGRGADFEVPASFDLSEHARRRPWEFPKEPPVEVTMRLAPRLTPAIPELFGDRARVESTPDGALVRIDVTHTDALISAVLPHGAAVEVLAPPALRARLAKTYAQLAARYAGGKDKKAKR
jgi:predicted DNA-binding transcriptional regulator YafY